MLKLKNTSGVECKEVNSRSRSSEGTTRAGKLGNSTYLPLSLNLVIGQVVMVASASGQKEPEARSLCLSSPPVHLTNGSDQFKESQSM